MGGERDLRRLLVGLRPRLRPEPVVYTRASTVPPGVRALATVVEDEGLTIVCPRGDADTAGLEYNYVAAWITLEAHSALDAVGLTAAVAAALADAGLSCNVLAGFFHDHLLVPFEDGPRAVAVLRALSASR